MKKITMKQLLHNLDLEIQRLRSDNRELKKQNLYQVSQYLELSIQLREHKETIAERDRALRSKTFWTDKKRAAFETSY